MKEYNDHRLASESTHNVMRQKFDESMEMEIRDLEDIYEKMLEQKKQIESSNSNGSLNSALKTTDENINELQSLIRKYALKSQQFKSRFELQKNPQSSGKFSFNNIKSFNLPESVHGKIPSSEEISRHASLDAIHQPNLGVPPSNNAGQMPENGAIPPNLREPNLNTENGPSMPNSSNNITSPDTAISPRNNEVPSRNSRRRNPMQGNILSAFAKALFLKNKANKENNLFSTNIQPIIADHRQNRFHNIIVQGEGCDPRRKLITGQVDLLRLLILFIALRPHSRYCSRIASIASSQFDVLLTLQG